MTRAQPATAGVCAIACLVLLSARANAHRLDEYLQAARVSLSVDAAVVELDLTPGQEIARSVIDTIDADRDGALSNVEQQAYATRVVSDLRLAVDGLTLHPAVTRLHYPSIEALVEGAGAIAVELRADFDSSSPGSHEFYLRNDHRADVGAYLANALVPETAVIAITGQRRDDDQRELRIDYEVRRGGVWPLPLIVAAIIALLGAAGYLRYRLR